MIVLKVILDDHTAAEMAAGCKKRMAGTIGYLDANTLSFNVWNNQREKKPSQYRKLPHGQVIVDQDTIQLKLKFPRDEQNISPAEALIAESFKAQIFVREILMKEEEEDI